MTFKDKIFVYLLHKSQFLDNDYDSQKSYYRYRNCDEVDYLECIIKKARKDLINEIMTDIISIISTQDKEQFKLLQRSDKNG